MSTNQTEIATTMHDRVLRKCGESIEVKHAFFDRYADQIGELCQRMADRFRSGGRMGNGGSACDAQHVAVEFVHPIMEKRCALPAQDLVGEMPVVTAIANDKDYARIFVDQLELWGRPEDMALAISTSGQSPNLIYALESARKKGDADHRLRRKGWRQNAGAGGILFCCSQLQYPSHTENPCHVAPHHVGLDSRKRWVKRTFYDRQWLAP